MVNVYAKSAMKKFLFQTGIRAEQYLSATKFFRRSTGKSKIIFFPGCSLSGYNPEYVFAVRDYLTEILGECGIFTACCAKPLKLIGDAKAFRHRIESVRHELNLMGTKTIITACQGCCKVLRTYDTEHNILSLWPLMQSNIPERLRGKFSGLEACVQDSCTSTPEIVSSIRKISAYLGIKIKEFPGVKLRCCGGAQLLASGDAKRGREIMCERANQAPSSTIISYCASCRSAMQIDGKHKSIHILDLIFGDGEASGKGSSLFNRFITARNLKEA